MSGVACGAAAVAWCGACPLSSCCAAPPAEGALAAALCAQHATSNNNYHRRVCMRMRACVGVDFLAHTHADCLARGCRVLSAMSDGVLCLLC